MKGVILAALSLLLVSKATTQPQRLVRLPSAMKVISTFSAVNYVPSLCIDYFRPGPGDEGVADIYSYYSFSNGAIPLNFKNLEFQSDYFRQVQITNSDGRTIAPVLNQPLYLSTEDDLKSISANKKQFINQKISTYRNKPFSSQKLPLLQDEIWAYDVLDHMDYIDSRLAFMDGYRQALLKFGVEINGTNEIASVHDVLYFGSKMPHVRDKKSILVSKTKNTNEYILFNSPGTISYRGKDIDLLIQKISESFSDGDIIKSTLINFENKLKEDAFYLNIKRKLFLVHEKEVFFSTNHSYRTSTEREYKPAVEIFNENSITEVNFEGTGQFIGQIEFEPIFAESDKLMVEALSNKKNAVTQFFAGFIDKVKELRYKFIARSIAKEVRKKVITGLDLKNGDYLDVKISEQGVIKDILRITHLGVESIYYVSR